MKSSAKNINLTLVDDLFSTEESRADAGREVEKIKRNVYDIMREEHRETQHKRAHDMEM